MDKCKSAPRLALLAGCMGASIVGWITILAEDESDSDSLWWTVLAPAIQVAILAFGLLKADKAAACLSLALGVYLGTVPNMFDSANFYDEAGNSDMSFGYTMGVLGGSLAWLSYVEVPGKLEFMAKAKLNTPVLGIFALSLFAMLLCWFDTGALSLSTWVAVTAFAFFSSVILAGGALGKSSWGVLLSIFLAAFVVHQSLQEVLGEHGNSGAIEFAAVLAFIGAVGQVGWTAHKVMGDGASFDQAKIKEKQGMALVVCVVVSFIGVILANQFPSYYPDDYDSDGYTYSTVLAFFVPIFALVGFATDGGRQETFYVFTAGMVVTTMSTLIPQSNSYAASEADEEGALEFGLALLEMVAFFVPVIIFMPKPADVMAAVKPAMPLEKMAPALAVIVMFVGWVLALIANMDDEDNEFVWAWLALITAAMLVGVLMKFEEQWCVVGFMAGLLGHVLFAVEIDSDEGMVTFSVLVYWIGSLFAGVAVLLNQKNEYGSGAVAEAAATAGEAAVPAV